MINEKGLRYKYLSASSQILAERLGLSGRYEQGDGMYRLRLFRGFLQNCDLTCFWESRVVYKVKYNVNQENKE